MRLLERTQVIAIEEGVQTNAGRGLYRIKVFWEGACVSLCVKGKTSSSNLRREQTTDDWTTVKIFGYK